MTYKIAQGVTHAGFGGGKCGLAKARVYKIAAVDPLHTPTIKWHKEWQMQVLEATHAGFKYSIVIPLSDICFFFPFIFIWYQSRNFPSIFIVLFHFMIIKPLDFSIFIPSLFNHSYPSQIFPLLFDIFSMLFFPPFKFPHYFFHNFSSNFA